ncbi:T9SS type A sorting domain-containing protein [bacterium]|nr:T9SS type A sorting domain-containing protein [bacterium]
MSKFTLPSPLFKGALILFILSIPFCLFAGLELVQKSPVGGGRFSDIQKISDEVYYLLNEWKGVFRSTDCGRTFEPVITASSAGFSGFTGMRFFTEDFGYLGCRTYDPSIYGFLRYILKTTNAGATWDTILAPSTIPGTGFYPGGGSFIDSLTIVCDAWGSADSAFVVYTTDGGESWERSHWLGFDIRVSWFNDSVYYYHWRGDNRVYATYDRGETSTLLFTPPLPPSILIRTVIPTGLDTFIITYPGLMYGELTCWPSQKEFGVLYTETGGAEWDTVLIDYFYDGYYKVAYSGGNIILYSAGEDVHYCIAITSDMGATWEIIEPPSYRSDLYTFVKSLGEDTVWVGSTKNVYFTEDGGASWNRVFPIDICTYLHICSTPDSNVWISDYLVQSYIYHFRNPDASDLTDIWAEPYFFGWEPTIDMWNSRYGFLIQRIYNLNDCYTIRRTTDGGHSWWTCFEDTVTEFWDIAVADSLHIWAVGIQTRWREGISNVTFSTDGGETWSRYDYPPLNLPIPMYSVYFYDSLLGFIGTYDDTLYRTEDGGESWETLEIRSAGGILDIFFLNDTLGWFVNGNSKIFKTTDGGLSWEHISYFSDVTSWDFDIPRPRGLHFINENEGFLASGDLYHTTDGGLSWEIIPLPADERIYNITFIDSTLGYAVGSPSLIYRWTADTTAIEEKRPERFSVSIFPNPANAQVKLKIISSRKTSSNLGIYNILGEKLQEKIVSLSPGENGFSFDFSNYPSGIYFLLLNGEQASIIQKIVILK